MRAEETAPIQPERDRAVCACGQRHTGYVLVPETLRDKDPWPYHVTTFCPDCFFTPRWRWAWHHKQENGDYEIVDDADRTLLEAAWRELPTLQAAGLLPRDESESAGELPPVEV